MFIIVIYVSKHKGDNKEKAQMLKQYKEMKAKMQENNYLILKLNKSLIKLTKYWNINYFIH